MKAAATKAPAPKQASISAFFRAVSAKPPQDNAVKSAAPVVAVPVKSALTQQAAPPAEPAKFKTVTTAAVNENMHANTANTVNTTDIPAGEGETSFSSFAAPVDPTLVKQAALAPQMPPLWPL